MFYWGLRSVVVITSASQAEGRRFEPSRKHSVYSTSAVFDYLDFFRNCFTSCILRVMKIFSSNSNLEKLVPRLSFFVKKVRLSSLHSSKTFLKATEHSWTKTILSTGGRRTLFNSRLMNKLMQSSEWVSEWVSERHSTAPQAHGCYVIQQQKLKNSVSVWDD